jgi:peptidoglycan/LPS O-acetylase OafA/YrhL
MGNEHGLFLQQSWTLCYEEQFYALTGLMLLVAPRRFFAAGLTLTTAVVLIMIFCQWHHVTTAGFFFDGSWMTFAAGMLVYYRINYAGWVLGGCLNSTLAAAAILGAYGIFPVPGE